MKYKYFLSYFLHCLTLFIGGSIYLLFRSDSLVLFSWLNFFNNLNSFILDLRDLTYDFSSSFPQWFIYSLPDGMWISSYLFLILMIFDFKIKKNNILYIFLIPSIGFLSEIGQFFGLVSGTFDYMDILLYLLCSIFPLLIFKKTISHEF